MEMGELVILLCLSFWCLGIVVFLLVFLMMLWVGLQCVIVVFPDHTHLFFLVDFLIVVQKHVYYPTCYIQDINAILVWSIRITTSNKTIVQ